MTTTGPEYGYLALERIKRDFFTRPDSTLEEFESEEDAYAARRRFVEEHVRPAMIEPVEEERELYRSGCEVKSRIVETVGRFTPNREVLDVIGPDGSTLFTAASEKEIDENFAESLKARFPDPPMHEKDVAGWVGRRYVWRGAIVVGGERTSLPRMYRWEFGFPIDQVLETLNKLSEDGWSVSHVSEDRGLYSYDSRTTSAPDVIRFLLTRAAAS